MFSSDLIDSLLLAAVAIWSARQQPAARVPISIQIGILLPDGEKAGAVAPGRYLEPMAGTPEEAPLAAPGGHGLRPDVGTEQRERLLAATVDLVSKRGYRNTSIDHIVKTARVGYVAFYELFDGKEDCFLAAFDRTVAETKAALAEAVAKESLWPRQMAAGLSRVLDLVAADPARGRFALIEVQAAGPSAYARYEVTLDEALPILREGRKFSPEAAGLSESLEEAVLGGVVWIVQQRLVKGELDDVEALLGETIQIALAPFLGDAEAKRQAEETLRERSSRE
ncbi:MAG TPA: TetR/AcrR family transcriptional regulator [Solirubrobacterales bacterium]